MPESLACPYCGRGDGQVKDGMNGASQRYKCAYCTRRYTVARKRRGYPSETRRKVMAMRAEGAGVEDIATACNVPKRTVYSWLSEAKAAASPADGITSAVPEPAVRQDVPKRASIRQVAEHAGVSVSTVSNFLNQSGRMSEATQKRISSAIEELHFAPSSLMRAIRERRTRILGLLTYGIGELDLPSSFITSTLAGLNEACRDADYDFLVYTNFWQPEKHYTGLSFLNGQVDGLVWVDPPMSESLLQRVGAAGFPAVALLTRHTPPGVGYVNAKNHAGMERIVEHLVQLGHRRIAYLGPAQSSNFADRRSGFWKGARQAGISDTCLEFSPHTDIWRMEAYDEALEMWCSSPLRPTAIVTADDGFALIVIAWLEAHGYHVPGDISVTGFNDAANAATGWPGGLTTIRQPFREIARTAARLLIEQLEGRAQTDACAVSLDVELVTRGSTGLAPAS